MSAEPTNAELATRFDAHEKADEARHVEIMAAVKATHDAAKPTWTFDSKTLGAMAALLTAITGLVTALGFRAVPATTDVEAAVHVVEQAQVAPAPTAPAE